MSKKMVKSRSGVVLSLVLLFTLLLNGYAIAQTEPGGASQKKELTDTFLMPPQGKLEVFTANPSLVTQHFSDSIAEADFLRLLTQQGYQPLFEASAVFSSPEEGSSVLAVPITKSGSKQSPIEIAVHARIASKKVSYIYQLYYDETSKMVTKEVFFDPSTNIGYEVDYKSGNVYQLSPQSPQASVEQQDVLDNIRLFIRCMVNRLFGSGTSSLCTIAKASYVVSKFATCTFTLPVCLQEIASYLAASAACGIAACAVDDSSISGIVSSNSGQPLSGVTLTLNPGVRPPTATDENGIFRFANIPAGEYTLTPSRSGCSFSPPPRSVSLQGTTARGGQNFEGNCDIPPPAVTFAINNGAASTTSRTVTLNNTATGSPAQYLASESAGFSGASWQSYSAAPSFMLSAGNGLKTVYFKVRNSAGVESTAKSDTITLNETKTLTAVSISGSSSVNRGACETYTASASFSDGTSQNITSSATWSENSAYASISSGRLCVSSSLPSTQTATVTASYTYNGTTKTGTKPVSMVTTQKTLTGVSISGPSSVNKGACATYTATAFFSDGTSQNITSSATWSENSAYASISSGRLCVSSSLPSTQTATVTASYTYNGTTKTAGKTVQIRK